MHSTPRLRAGCAALSGLLIVAAAGCAKKNPAVGTWAAADNQATLTLAADGTGTLSVPRLPMLSNKPVTWKQGEKPGIVTLDLGAPPQGSMVSPAGGNLSFTGAIADDEKTMSIVFPMANFSLVKQESK